MDILTFAAIGKILSDQVKSWSESHRPKHAPPSVGELLTAWQMCWLLHACNFNTPAQVLRLFTEIIQNQLPRTPQEIILCAWMQHRGLPQQPAPRQSSTEIIFFETLRGLVSTGSEQIAADEFVFRILRIVAGLKDEDREAIMSLIQQSQQTQLQPRLSAVRDSPAQQWLTADEVTAQAMKELPQRAFRGTSRVVLVSLAEPLNTPMSWRMKGEVPAIEHRICLGWPLKGQTTLTGPEQHALLAHELRHVRQLLTECEGHPAEPMSTREFQALQSEWEELCFRISKIPKQEAEEIRKRWRNLHETEQLRLFRNEFYQFKEAIQSEKGAPAAFFHASPRLPFSSLIYALCAKRIH